MKQILAMMVAVVLVGCGKSKEAQGPSQPEPATPPKASPTKLIADPIVEKEVRWWLEKPEGELTEADLAEVYSLEFWRRGSNQITDEGLKELAKLQNLEELTFEIYNGESIINETTNSIIHNPLI